jgi:hypothetical protein
VHQYAYVWLCTVIIKNSDISQTLYGRTIQPETELRYRRATRYFTTITAAKKMIDVIILDPL